MRFQTMLAIVAFCLLVAPHAHALEPSYDDLVTPRPRAAALVPPAATGAAVGAAAKQVAAMTTLKNFLVPAKWPDFIFKSGRLLTYASRRAIALTGVAGVAAHVLAQALTGGVAGIDFGSAIASSLAATTALAFLPVGSPLLVAMGTAMVAGMAGEALWKAVRP
jgi:hypothetical protein